VKCQSDGSCSAKEKQRVDNVMFSLFFDRGFENDFVGCPLVLGKLFPENG